MPGATACRVVHHQCVLWYISSCIVVVKFINFYHDLLWQWLHPLQQAITALTAGNSTQAMPILGIGILFAETYKMEILAQLKMNFLAAMSIVGGVRWQMLASTKGSQRPRELHNSLFQIPVAVATQTEYLETRPVSIPSWSTHLLLGSIAEEVQ